jgi:phage shock protein B
MPNELIPVLIVFIVIGVPVICGTILALAKTVQGGGRKSGNKLDEEQTRILQELHRGMNRMEARVEALETIILERDRARPR